MLYIVNQLYVNLMFKMVTLEDISIQLLKPAKDLADWKFPLSQILEEYYVRLEEPCDVNFGEAGLVVQNSTNAYVQRIERLHQLLKQATEEEEKNSVQRTKKSYANFDNFVIIDMEKDAGIKGIDKKEQSPQKKVNLLSRRFTQLENDITQTHAPIKIYDVSEEVIGEKYDFRCNQSVNTNGMLVDELTSYDFTSIPYSPTREDRNSTSIYSEPKTPGTGTSGYHSYQTDDSIMLHDDLHYDEFEDEHNCSPMDNITENQSEFIGNNEDATSNCNGFSPVKDDDNLEQIIAGTDTVRKEKTELSTVENDRDSLNENAKRVQDNMEKETSNRDKNVESFESKEQMKRKKSKKKRIDEWKPKITSTRCMSELSKDVWKPMPMTRGSNNTFTTNKCVLKLPDCISMLDSKLSRKRKYESEYRKPECLARFMLREKSLDGLNNVRVLRRPKFEHLQKHELEDFMKNLDKCLSRFGTEDVNGNNTCLQDAAEPVDSVQCETVAQHLDTELLKSRVSSNDQEKSVENDENEIEGTRSRRSSFADIAPPSPIYDDNEYNSVEKSPESNVNDSSYSLSNYETLIEEKMREIIEDEDTTELNQTVTNWHEFLQPRLLVNENHNEFRINEYTSSILDTLRASEKEDSTFDNVVQGKPSYEVARYFLALLQLANTCNVEIKKDCDNIQLKLLNDKGDSRQS